MIEVHGTDEQLPSLFAALAKALAEIGPVTKDNTATARGGRQYSYADLTAVLDTIRPVLHTHDLWYSQNPGQIREVGSILVQTIDAIIGHGGGAYILYRTDIPMSQQTEQGMGIGTSYGRRYQAVGNWAVGMEDNDGQVTRSAPAAGSGAPTGHLAQAALDLGAKPVVRTQFRQQLDETIDSMKGTPSEYPSKGLIGMYLNNGEVMAAIDDAKLSAWASANPGVPPIELMRVAAQYAASMLPAGLTQAKAAEWHEANS